MAEGSVYRVLGPAPRPDVRDVPVAVPGGTLRLGVREPDGGLLSSATPVLLLHGLASQRRFWDSVLDELGGVRVGVLDQRGHGDSAAVGGPFDVPTVAADAETALDAAGFADAVVVGHSWGGAVAATMAAQAPGRVRALIVIDGGFAATPDDVPRDQLRQRLAPPRIAAPPEELSRRVPPPVLANFAVGPDGLARARLTYERHMEVLEGMLDYDPASTLGVIRCPAWLVSCEPARHDNLDEQTAGWLRRKAAGLDAAARLMRDARPMRWGGAIHDVPLQGPALVAGLVRAAVAEVGRRDDDRA
jgi:pimeloyl-ACP methyl ester carboxylesterase